MRQDCATALQCSLGNRARLCLKKKKRERPQEIIVGNQGHDTEKRGQPIKVHDEQVSSVGNRGSVLLENAGN